MKKIFPLLFACAGMALFSVSCSTDYDASPDVQKDNIRNPLQGDFTAVVDGIQFTANTKSFVDTVIAGQHVVSFSGTEDSPEKDPGTNKTIVLSIPDYTGAKSYAVDGMVSGAYITRDSGEITTYTAKPGDTVSVINITNDGDKWEGTFHMVVAPANGSGGSDITISQGSFSIPK